MIYLGACNGSAPPVCAPCLNCNELTPAAVSDGYEVIQAFPYDEPCVWGGSSYYNNLAHSTVQNVACLGIPLDAEFSLTIDLAWTTSSMCSQSLSITLDKVSGVPDVAIGSTWTSGLFDPGPWSSIVDESDELISDWILIPGALREFRIRAPVAAQYYVSTCDYEATAFYRYITATCNAVFEWQVPP